MSQANQDLPIRKYTPDKTIEELAREQGVTPGSLDRWLATAEPWPEDEDDGVDIDEFLAMIRGRPRPEPPEKPS